MRAYVASSFALAGRIPAVEKALADAGWSIIDRWWAMDEKGNFSQDPKEFYAAPVVQAIAARHWQAIKAADALVLVADDTPTRFTGAAVEFGYAHALGKPCVVIGQAKLSAMWAPGIHCPTLAEFARVMRDLNFNNERNPAVVKLEATDE